MRSDDMEVYAENGDLGLFRFWEGSLALDDPAVLLGVITELRKRGYTVEPGAV